MNKSDIVKRLNSIKMAIELKDEDILELHLNKLKKEKDKDLEKIINLIETELKTEDGYSKISKAISNYINSVTDAKLTPHQQDIFNNITKEFKDILENFDDREKSVDNNFVSLSGSAGVGKTFVTSKLIEHFIKNNYKVLLTTPTHKSLNVAKYMLINSNIDINSKTLQSYLKIKLKEDLINGTKKFVKDMLSSRYDYVDNLDILIVDESSMISKKLLKFIEENLEQNKLKSVLFIGDPYQLPPVDEPTNGIDKLSKKYELTEVVRQAKDSYIKMIAIKLKNCIKDKNYLSLGEIFDRRKYPELKIFNNEEDFLEDFTTNEEWYKCKNIALSFSNKDVDRENRILRDKYWLLSGIESKDYIIKDDVLTFNEPYKNHLFQNSETILVAKAKKKFDKYIKINYWECEDKYTRKFKVVDIDDKKKFNEYVQKIADKAIKIPKSKKEERKKAWAHYFATKEKYADVKYIFATTIHKSQGSTYENVYINIASMRYLFSKDKDLAYRLLYVAVTRASKDIRVLL